MNCRTLQSKPQLGTSSLTSELSSPSSVSPSANQISTVSGLFQALAYWKLRKRVPMQSVCLLDHSPNQGVEVMMVQERWLK